MSLTKVSYSMITGECINVLDYGADPTGATNSYTALMAAFTAAGSSLTAPGLTPVFFPHGLYRIDTPLLIGDAYKIYGDNATIIAGSGFTPINVEHADGSITSMDHMLIFCRGSGTITRNAYINNGIVFDCNEVAQGIYVELMPYSEFCCSVQNSKKNGIDIGTTCWGLYLNSVVVENFTENAITLGAAANGVQITNPIIWGKNKTGAAGIVCTEDCDANGICISGGFIEKIDVGFAAQARTGPVEIIGVDFEVCTNNCISAIGNLTGPAGRLIGPITAKNCYMDCDGVKVYSEGATVVVENCRLTLGDDFESDPSIQGKIVALHNEYQNGNAVIVAASAVCTDDTTQQTHILRNYTPHSYLAYTPGYEIQNYQYAALPSTQSSGLFFKSSNQGSNRYLSVSNWFITEYRPATSPGVIYQTIGVQLDNRTGQQAFGPVEDNTHSLGQAAYRWSVVYAANGTINTSDANEKQQIRSLDDAEKATALQIKGLIKAFKFNEAVAAKGDKARIHVGAIAQEVEQAFKDNGLDPEQYGMFCRDVWYTLDGELVLADTENAVKHERLGLRYEQMLAFIIASI